MRKSLSLVAIIMLSLVALSTPVNAAKQTPDFTEKLNAHLDKIGLSEKRVSAGSVNAMGLIDEILHLEYPAAVVLDSYFGKAGGCQGFGSWAF